MVGKEHSGLFVTRIGSEKIADWSWMILPPGERKGEGKTTVSILTEKKSAHVQGTGPANE